MRVWQNRASCFLLLLLAVLSLYQLLVDSFFLTVSPSTYLYLIVLCVFLTISACFRQGILIGMPLSGALLYYYYHTYALDLYQELIDVLDRISETYYYHYYSAESFQAFSSSSVSHSTVVLFFMFIISALIASSLTAVTWRIPLCLLSTVPLFSFCIAVNGNLRPASAVGIVLFWLLLLMTGNKYQNEGNAGRFFFIGLVPCLLFIFVLFFICKPANYHPDEHDLGLSQTFSQLEKTFGNWVSSHSYSFPISSSAVPSQDQYEDAELRHQPLKTGWGVLGQPLDMTQPYDPASSHMNILQVKTDSPQVLYLRGISYGDYTGTGWENAGNYLPSSLSFAEMNLRLIQTANAHTFDIRTEQAYEYLFLPYYSSSQSSSDSFIASNGNDYYRGTFFTGFEPVGEDYFSSFDNSEELAYREYAHNYYTRLPDATRAAILTLCEENGLYSGSSDIIRQVAAFVRDRADYNLSAAPFSCDDFAVFFLTDAHEGYCIHFATAAAVIYRALGIPARLTEGFIASTDGYTYTQITGEDAHAWVELYLDGFGWFPIDVTPSSDAHSSGLPNQFDSQGDQNRDTAPDPQSSTNEYETGDSYLPNSEHPSAPSSSIMVSQADPSVSESLSIQTSQQRIFSIVFRLCFCFLISIILVSLQYRIRILVFRLRYRKSSTRQKAVLLWSTAKKMTAFGYTIPEQIQICAERARFSSHVISESEIKQTEDVFLDHLQLVYSGLSKRQKLKMKYIKGIGGSLL